jgi:hypothetical protein
MIYEALCIDNTKFFERGTITVRIFKYYNVPRYFNGKRTDDLSTKKELLETKNDKGYTQDFEAKIFTPLGGGRNYGMFILPQINSKGLVAFLEGAFNRPIWLGSFFDNIFDGNNKRQEIVNIPSDKPESEGTDSDGVTERAYNLDNDSRTIILRTKHTYVDGDDVSNLNWQNINTENLVAIDNKKIRIRHFTKWSDNQQKKYQEILISQETSGDSAEYIQLDVNNIEGDKRGTLKLTESGFRIDLVNGDDTYTFDLTAGDSWINLTDGQGNQIIGKSDGLHLITDIDNKKIYLNGEDTEIDSLVKYTDLKTIIDAFASHIHYGEHGSIITSKPVDNKLAPINIKKPERNMEAINIKTDK